MSGNVADKATAFKNEVTGSTTKKIVCKASNHDVAGPKKKHVDCKCACTHTVALCVHTFVSPVCSSYELIRATLVVWRFALRVCIRAQVTVSSRDTSTYEKSACDRSTRLYACVCMCHCLQD